MFNVKLNKTTIPKYIQILKHSFKVISSIGKLNMALTQKY